MEGAETMKRTRSVTVELVLPSDCDLGLVCRRSLCLAEKKERSVRSLYRLGIIGACAGLLAFGFSQCVDGAQLGKLKADRILFLGNSITLCLPNNWGLAASTDAKDYAHLLAGAIESRTGATLRMVPMDKALVGGEQQPGKANIVNVAHIFERNYATYDRSKLEKQIDAKPDIVILQFGENVPPQTFNAAIFKASLQKLVGDLKASGDPHIFMAGMILGSNATIDNIKRSVCAEDPSRRVFVDMSDVAKDRANIGDFGHPGDKGMALIADTLFKAVAAHAAVQSDVQ
jgi:lysophospholipase L1-like esterase